ncbi:hypothetical protein [Neisseria polysaccharea]|uniref:hypothetical protein n=1 Tax=Neisseria polysaccharea TaxID=489 RepID=UPI001ABF2027|nr:hypothetical protein [Neisseria polysaccharea]
MLYHKKAKYKEPSLGSYALLDAYVSHTQKHGRYSTEWFLDGRNLTNRTARAKLHTQIHCAAARTFYPRQCENFAINIKYRL